MRSAFGTRRETAPQIREIDRRGFYRRLDAMLATYAAAMEPPVDQMPGRRTIMERHAAYPGFRAFVAGRRRDVVGFAYGFRGEPGQWWHDVVHAALAETGGPEHAQAWMGDTFEVAELHVHPDSQGQGLGRRLITTLCADRPERNVVLSTLDAETPARNLYRSLGLTDLLTAFRFPGGGPLYAVMGARLPLSSRRS
ncbi:GNAT family N-acetyltransferase [Actinoallomurus spadix]|uniref:GNAT family N-acetyltransferase n=1 Tax=Actinoallomurus spadix TaxID=79912 RepID=A0ABN0W517_9ACTN|nr:GNAT family N-acetyltransferase [Actinoallomurus spadix]MCO5985630.1 GNAT family N-acetyltransferase [Actinoallomurus spadix]